MDAGRSRGLPPHLQWLADQRFWVTLATCWTISPVMILVIAVVLEGRVPSFDLDLQFWSFFPGDLFLGLMFTGLLRLARRLPNERRWYNSVKWYATVQLVTIGLASLLYYSEIKQGYYTPGQMRSASKFYHHGFLYGIYGCTIVVTLVAVLAGSSYSKRFVWSLVVCLLPGMIWMGAVQRDATLSPSEARPLVANAHPTRSTPIWEGPAWWHSIRASLR